MNKVFVVKQRNLFKHDSDKPFKASRSQIEAFVQCARCFWLNHRMGIRQTSFAPYTINSLVDRMLKKEFDVHRAEGTAHPIMVEHQINAVPFPHESMETWRNNFKGLQFLHKPTNLLITGAVDDIWQRRNNGNLIVVDYKATSVSKEITLDDDWKISYKRQAEVYTWLLRKQEIGRVDQSAYFLYANGQDVESFNHKIHFTTTLLEYKTNTAWIEPTLFEMKACLLSDMMPPSPPDCEHCGYVAAVVKVS